MEITIIVTTQNRVNEIIRFFKSINYQKNVNFNNIQLIFVDQGNCEKCIKLLNSNIKIKYIKSDKCSLSQARNKAIPFVKGDIIAFGDDDCWYVPDTLSKVISRFDEGYDGIIANSKDECGRDYMVQPDKEQLITPTDRCGAISFCIFLKYDKELRFDENLGVGSPYHLSSGEETDYLLSYIEKNPNYKILYDPSIIVHHPSGKNGNFKNEVQKSYEYARGYGRVMRKHKSITLPSRIKSFYRPFLGMLIYFVKGNKIKSHRSFMLLKGRLEGYMWKEHK